MLRRQVLLGAGGMLAHRTVSAVRLNPAWPRALTMGTARPGGIYAVYGPAWGAIAQRATGVNVAYRATEGAQENIILIDDAQVDLGMTTFGVAREAWTGTGRWTQGVRFHNIRALFPMYETAFHGVARPASAIADASALAGRVLGVGPRGGTAGAYVPTMLRVLGIHPSAIRYGSVADQVGAVVAGRLDACLFAAGVPVPAFAAAQNRGATRLFGFSPPQIGRLVSALPGLSTSVIDRGTYQGLAHDLKVAVMFNFAIGRASLPDDLVQTMTRAVMTKAGRLCIATPAAVGTIAANAARDRFLPFHPGAARYFRQAGVAIPPRLVAG